MYSQSDSSILNKVSGNFQFDLHKFEENCLDGQIHRNNYFSLIWVTEGFGKIKTGFSEYDFSENTLFAFAPFQPFLFSPHSPIKGIVINFHPEFMFVHQHDNKNDFEEVLYYNVEHPPFVKIDKNSAAVFNMLCEKMEAEMQNTSLAQHEILAAYLSILLINTSRLKMEQNPQETGVEKNCKEHYMLKKLKDAIEENFRVKHTPREYASMLYVTTKTLSKISKSYYNKTLSNIINDRIVTEAKRELYLTKKAIKEIAYNLGYEDEYYFSRFFKVNAQISPKKYRETVGFNAA
jgi:AraC-like DNA-binding protein